MTIATAPSRVEELFIESGAYTQGHFLLKSGRHSDRYLEKFQVLQWPEHVRELCRLIVQRAQTIAGEDGGSPIQVVIGPTTGGVILAYEVARQLGVRGIFAEQEISLDWSKRRVLRRGFRIEPGERTLLVDDLVTTGASLAEVLPLIEELRGDLVAAMVIVDRTGGLTKVDSPTSAKEYRAEALWSLNLPTFDPGESCPGCRAGLPLEAPGTSGTLPAATR